MKLSNAQIRALKSANAEDLVFEGNGNRYDSLLVLERKGALELLRNEKCTVATRGAFGRGHYKTRECSENIYRITDAGKAAVA